MYKEHWIHSLLYFKFVELTLNEILGLGMAAHGDDFRVVIIDKFPLYINSYTSWIQHLTHECNPQEYTFVSRITKDRLLIIGGSGYFRLVDNRNQE
mgnify:FL=1